MITVPVNVVEFLPTKSIRVELSAESVYKKVFPTLPPSIKLEPLVENPVNPVPKATRDNAKLPIPISSLV